MNDPNGLKPTSKEICTHHLSCIIRHMRTAISSNRSAFAQMLRIAAQMIDEVRE